MVGCVLIVPFFISFFGGPFRRVSALRRTWVYKQMKGIKFICFIFIFL